MASTKSEQKVFREYLVENNCFHIPGFQRNYSWDEDNVSDLVEDLFSLMDNSDREDHFFGQIITYLDDGNVEIIDGQQRLTTVFIFLGVIKQILLDEKKDLEQSENTDDLTSRIQNTVNQIDSLILQAPKGFYDDDKILKLQLQEDFHGNLPQHSLNKLLGFDDDGVDVDKRTVKNHIEENFNFMKKIINKKVEDLSINQRLQSLLYIMNTILDKFSIVVIDADNRGNAFIIFQTINIRGKELTSADIIKSHVVSLDKSGKDIFLKKWSDIYDTLGRDDTNIANFIKDYVWARFSSPRDRDLYREVSKIVKTEEAANQFLDDLIELKDLYRSLIENSNSTFVSKIKRQYESTEPNTDDLTYNITEILFSLNRMGEKLHFPILLAMKKNNLKLGTTLVILNKVYKIIVRNNIIVGMANNKLTKKIASVARNIWKAKVGSDLDTNNILNGFNDISVDDVQVSDSFVHLKRKGGKQGTQYGTLTVLLHSIYDNSGLMNDNDVNYYFKNFANNNYKLVHLSPDDVLESIDDFGLVAEWTFVEKSILDDEKVDYDNKISLTKEERINVLQRSDVRANKEIANILKNNGNVWNNYEINERQNDFSHEAVQIWN